MKLIALTTTLLAAAANTPAAAASVRGRDKQQQHDQQEASTTTTKKRHHLRAQPLVEDDDRPTTPCIPGRYYYVFDSGSNRQRIGSLDPQNVDEADNREHSRPSKEDCQSLRYLAFDRSGAAYGQCRNHRGTGIDALVRVELGSGDVAKLAEFPSRRSSIGGQVLDVDYEGLAYNPADDHFYTTVTEGAAYSLVRIDKKDWTLTHFDDVSFGGTTMSGLDLTIDSNGNAFGTNLLGELFSIDLTTGASEQVGGSSSPLLPRHRSGNIAFDGDDMLYGIDYSYPASLFTIDVTTSGTADDETTERAVVTTTNIIQDSDAIGTRGGAFCPWFPAVSSS